jgi:hypothetical protein
MHQLRQLPVSILGELGTECDHELLQKHSPAHGLHNVHVMMLDYP